MGSKNGLFLPLIVGLLLQLIAICSLIPLPLLAAFDRIAMIAFACVCQSITGIAKDMIKISGKASTKLFKVLKKDNDDSVFKLVALLTGSKNAVKGFGFFLGSLLINFLSYYVSLGILATLILVLVPLVFQVDRNIGKSKLISKKSDLFNYDNKVTTLSVARFFLFGSRDCWFEIVLPLHLRLVFGWDYVFCGGVMAIWIIMYGAVQAITPELILAPLKTTARVSNLSFTTLLGLQTLGLALFLQLYKSEDKLQLVLFLVQIYVFGFLFAVCSSVHSFLIVDISSKDRIASTLGYYYMANAGGRMVGTLVSGFAYFYFGIQGCLWTSFAMLVITIIVSKRLGTILDANKQIE